MNLSAIKSTWEELQQSTYATELQTSLIDNLDLNLLKSNLTIQLNKFLSAKTNENMNLESFIQDTEKLENIIPKLNGNEQVYYAKLYRVCKLLLDNHPKG